MTAYVKKSLRLESLESRHLLASISGGVWIDHNGNASLDSSDGSVPSAILWIDSNRNGIREAGEPVTRSAADGTFSFDGLAAGQYEVRLQPTPGLFQTSPATYVAFHRSQSSASHFGLAEIDIATGAVTELSSAVGSIRHGLIKTIQGEYYGAGHVWDSLYKIDPVTGFHQLIGHTGKGLVGGLTYDPVMDKIYTLGHDANVDPSIDLPPLQLYEINRQTAELTRVGNGVGVSNVRGTSGVAFDQVNREVILFDNNLNEIIAYDLNGQGRKVFQFPGAMEFYNLAFDGHRLVTFHRNAENVTTIFEIDRVARALVPIRSIQGQLSFEAAEIIGPNQALRITLASDSSQVTNADFFTNQMNLSESSLQVTDTDLTLTSMIEGLDVKFPIVDSTSQLLFCVGAVPSQLTIDQNVSVQPGLNIKTSDLDDLVKLNAKPQFALVMGKGHDTLAFTQPAQINLTDLATKVSGVDEIDLREAGALKLSVNSAAIRTLSDASDLSVVLASRDQLDLGTQDWHADKPLISGLTRRHQLLVGDVLLQLTDGLGWRNPLLAEDVNRDGEVTAMDALIIINELNSLGARQLVTQSAVDAHADYLDPS
ncbi:MAG: hypothetical protein IT423_11410, partial [Pirellulaceae bacterium]|nr:hypothetical protein [Pirellulaceae bacterium]